MIPRLTTVITWLAMAAAAQAETTINGVTDENWGYNNSATFTVVTEAGYDYAALLNGKAVSVGVPVRVGVDYYEWIAYRTNQVSAAVER